MDVTYGGIDIGHNDGMLVDWIYTVNRINRTSGGLSPGLSIGDGIIYG